MSFEAQCPQCMFVSRQLMQPTPCLLHVSPDFQAEQLVASKPASAVSVDYDEPYEFGQLRLTVDRPGPFSLREYVRRLCIPDRPTGDRPAGTPPPRTCTADRSGASVPARAGGDPGARGDGALPGGTRAGCLAW